MQRKPFAILRPVDEPWTPEPREEDIVRGPIRPDKHCYVRVSLASAKLVVLDCETKGTEAWNPETEIVGLGLVWLDENDELQAKYYDWPSLSTNERQTLWATLRCLNCDLIAHNALFDYALTAMQSERDSWIPAPWSKRRPSPTGFESSLPFTLCTFGLLKQLAGEGFDGQSWSLKAAMTDLLRWSETNERGIDDWLIAHGYWTSGPTKDVDGESPEARLRRAREWESEKEGRAVRPDKSEMYRCPASILGGYCLKDCFATLDLYLRVLRPALDRFPELEEFHRGPWMAEVRTLANQTYLGMRVDRAALEQQADTLRRRIADAERDMRAHAQLGLRITELEAAWLKEERDEILAKEPPRTTKGGKPSKRYENWRARLDGAAERATRFNPASGPHLRALLYEGDAPLVETRKGDSAETFVLVGKNGPVTLDRTDSGLLGVDDEALSQLDSALVGSISAFKDASKELSYVEDYIARLHHHPDEQWRLHPGWIFPGTVTGRLAGVAPNLQQIPKTLEVLDHFVPNEGCVWLEADAAALEPHVLAELSGDAALLALYGEGANPNHDRYLFTLANIPLPFFDEVRRHYDPKNPTKEGVRAAKAACKGLRELAKILVLSGDYGAGARKKWRACQLRGIDVSLPQMEEIHAAQLALHNGAAAFRRSLEQEWRARRGWVLSGLGFPTCVDEKYLKDIVNRVIQRTGHDLLTIELWILGSFLDEAGIPWRGVVADFHDEYILEVPRERADDALECARMAARELNEYVGASVRIKFDPRLCHSLSEAKLEEAHAARELQSLR
jgi:hypothetical protein